MTTLEIASRKNHEVAALRDDQIFVSRKGRERRAAALAATESPIIGTASEIGERYGHLFASDYNWRAVADHAADEVFIWSFDCATPNRWGRRDIDIAAIEPSDTPDND